jgi:putative ABC transport system permease protein
LKALGYGPVAIFLAFQLEAVLLGLAGGILGCLLVLPLNGAETGTMNQTFSEVTFAFRMTPWVMVCSVVFASALGLVGGAWPAARAARMTPTAALRRA